MAHAQIGLVQFPGSNCDADCVDAFRRLFDLDLKLIWHEEHTLPKLDGVILPGGFSYGDYLRSGALASFSPIMSAVKAFAAKGGPILGICNGFQVLTESHLLPGALLRNDARLFVCKQTNLVVPEQGTSGYHKALKDRSYKIPVAHGEGRYFIDQDGLKKLQDKGQIIFQYADDQGSVVAEASPNGAVANIAGILSENGRVLGMMPHPERASDPLLGSSDGRFILSAFLETVH